MVRFAPADPFDDETPAADPLGEAPVAAPRRRSRRLAAPSFAPTNPLLEQAFPSWARPPKEPAVLPASRRGFPRRRRSRFVGSNSSPRSAVRRRAAPAPRLARRDRLRRPGAPSRRFRPRCATPSISRQRRRDAPTSPAGRVHRLWRLFASRPTPLDASTLRIAADLVGLDGRHEFRRPRRLPAGHRGQRRTSAGGGRGRQRRGDETASRARRASTRRIFALWLADLALARRLGWDAPVPLLATAIAHASLRRGPSGKRPRPGDPDWVDAAAGAYAMAAQEAYALAGELARRCAKNFSRPSPNCGPRGQVGSSNFCSRTMPCRRRAPRNPRGYPIAPRAACSIGSSSLAPCANSPAAPNFRLYGL